MTNRDPDPARPDASEYPPYYAGYIAVVPDGPILATLAAQGRDTLALLTGVSDERALRRYAPGKWSLNEVVGHVIDIERLFGMRALAFARGERSRLFGIEHDDWVAAADFDARPFAELLLEFEAVRRSTLTLFGGFRGAQWTQRGVASGVEFAVRAIPWILAGHERHHVGVIRERYLAA